MSKPIRVQVRQRRGETTLKVLSIGAKGRPVPVRQVVIKTDNLRQWAGNEQNLRDLIEGVKPAS